MNLDFTQTPVLELVARFGIDVLAMVALVFGMYYRRYRDKELVTAAALFNIFAFAVLTILSSVEFSVAAGFGLFAILALFSLRSEQISKTEITYFFGSVAIAVRGRRARVGRRSSIQSERQPRPRRWSQTARPSAAPEQ